MADIRRCKKCGCELSDETKGNYCINCKGKMRSKLKVAGTVAAGVVVASVGLLAKVIFKKHL